MIETLAPFYGLDPEPGTVSTPPASGSREWLAKALQASEERVADLEAELAALESPGVPPAGSDPEVVLRWIREERNRVDREKETGLDWALDLVERYLDPPAEGS